MQIASKLIEGQR